jgi:4-carboxymuconolactone decarboxylase
MNPSKDRMPPLRDEQMNDVQRVAAAELIAGPRKGVKGPFIPLLRSPELMARLQKVGEYLRFESALTPRISEFATLVVSRQWTQQFEWAMHAPLALKSGTQPLTIDELAEGSRPATMSPEEALVYDFACELTYNRGVCDETYRKAIEAFGERGVIDLVGIIGYFALISMVLNVAHTPPESASAIAALSPMPR